MDREDCFAYRNGRCVALTEKDCEDCKFYKTKHQAALDRKKASDRLQNLGYVFKPGEYEK